MKRAPYLLVCLGMLLFLSGCPLCLIGAGGVGYTAGEAAADKERGMGDVLSDGVVTTKINAAFTSNKKISVWDIDVDTRLGVVTLRGYVKNKEVIAEAIKTARTVGGVKEVKSLLVVDKGDK